MKRILIAALVALAVAGCGAPNKPTAASSATTSPTQSAEDRYVSALRASGHVADGDEGKAGAIQAGQLYCSYIKLGKSEIDANADTMHDSNLAPDQLDQIVRAAMQTLCPH